MYLTLELPRAQTAPGQARAVLAAQLGHRLDAARMSDLHLIVSELVTNALMHGRGAITLHVRLDGDRIAGEVSDEGSGFEAEVRERGFHEVGGHGLQLVGALSDRWGTYDGSSHVWFELDAAEEHDDAALGPELGPGAPDVAF